MDLLLSLGDMAFAIKPRTIAMRSKGLGVVSAVTHHLQLNMPMRSVLFACETAAPID
jgi:hypothetical protein